MVREAAAGLRRLGWVSLPLVGMISVAAEWASRGRVPAGLVRPAALLLPDLSLGAGFVHGGARAELITLAALVTVGLALATVSNLVLRGVGERRPMRRFVLLWAGSAAAALLATGAVSLGHLLASTGAPARAIVFAAVVPALLTSAHWALLWGLVGAAVTAWLGPPRPIATTGPALYVRIAVAAILLVSTLGAAGGLAAAAALARGAAEPPPAMPTPAASAPAPSAEPSDPALLTNPDPDPAFLGRCPAAAVEISYRFADAAAGRRFGLVTATNTGGKPCALKGYPDLAFADVEGNNVRVKYEHGRWDGSKAKVRKVVLDPGRSARAELTWRGDGGAYDRKVDTILAAPWAGAKRTSSPDHFDIKNGSVMRVSPWLPTV